MRDAADGHAAVALVLAQFAAAEVAGGVGDDAVEGGAAVEGAVGVADEVENHAALFEDQPLGSRLSAEAAQGNDAQEFLALGWHGAEAVLQALAEGRNLLVGL